MHKNRISNAVRHWIIERASQAKTAPAIGQALVTAMLEAGWQPGELSAEEVKPLLIEAITAAGRRSAMTTAWMPRRGVPGLLRVAA